MLCDLRDCDPCVDDVEKERRRDGERIECTRHREACVHEADACEGAGVAQEGDEENKAVVAKRVVLLVLLDPPLIQMIAEIDHNDALVDEEQRRHEARDPREGRKEVVGSKEGADKDQDQHGDLGEPEASMHTTSEGASARREEHHDEEETRERECRAVDGPVPAGVERDNARMINGSGQRRGGAVQRTPCSCQRCKSCMRNRYIRSRGTHLAHICLMRTRH